MKSNIYTVPQVTYLTIPIKTVLCASTTGATNEQFDDETEFIWS